MAFRLDLDLDPPSVHDHLAVPRAMSTIDAHWAEQNICSNLCPTVARARLDETCPCPAEVLEPDGRRHAIDEREPGRGGSDARQACGRVGRRGDPEGRVSLEPGGACDPDADGALVDRDARPARLTRRSGDQRPAGREPTLAHDGHRFVPRALPAARHAEPSLPAAKGLATCL